MSRASSAPVIRLRGVRHNNLKNFDLDLPLGQLIVITGPSGSGKSSLAFDTLYAEGQRRYIETFSPYARQFFDRMDKPQVDHIEGIPPAIAIEQRNTVKTTRSTVGTMTEICDYLKVLWPHVAQLHCKQCGQPVRKDSPQQIWESLVAADVSPQPRSSGRSREMQPPTHVGSHEVLLTFDLPLSEKLPLDESLALIAKQGYQRLLVECEAGRAAVEESLFLREAAAPIYRTRADAEAKPPKELRVLRLDEATPVLRELKPKSLTIVQDRVQLTATNRARSVAACEQAYHFGKGKLAIRIRRPDAPFPPERPPDVTIQRFNDSTIPRFHGSPLRFSNRFHCAACDLEYREPTPALFSFNHPLGACPTCRGFGRTITIDYELAIPDRTRTLAEGAVKPWQSGQSAECQDDLLKFCQRRKVPTDVPFKDLPPELQSWVIDGDPDYGKDERHQWPKAWYGVKGYFRWLESKAYKMHVRVLLSRYRSYVTCVDCGGRRFQPEALLYKLRNAECGMRDDLTPRLSAIGDRRSAIPTAPTPADSQSPIANGRSALTLADFYALPLRDACALIQQLAALRKSKPSEPLGLALGEVRARLGYLVEVGLGYLTLDRPTRSLSGGETERVNLTTCLGTRLVNTLYVLDEPSVGLHPRDTARLVRILKALRDLGNTVVVVEHEAGVIRAADHLVDLGPGHGESGGQVVFQGTFREILRAKGSLTGAYLSGRKAIDVPRRRPVNLGLASSPCAKPRQPANSQRTGKTESAGQANHWPEACPALLLTHATRHNLRNLTVEIPLGRFVCVTGVSGSGKTTLVREVLLPALEAHLKSQLSTLKSTKAENEDDDDNGSHITHQTSRITGWKHLSRVVLVDQSPLGRTPRSNPAVYIGAFDDIRECFAQSELAQQRGLNASAFSFNSPQGQCERCRGAGFEKVEMQFLSDVFIRCPDCNGRRYRPHILEVKVSSQLPVASCQRVRGRSATDHGLRTTDFCWSIADLLDATVEEVIDFLRPFTDSRPAQRAAASLRLLQEVGLGYLRLGQPINTLSGGESQRLKLVSFLAEARVEAGRDVPAAPREGNTSVQDGGLKPVPQTLFLFDEPTTGLHFDDVRVLLQVFQRLVDSGHSVVVVEHNLDVIKCADWIIDLGPEAGDEGGQLVAQGTPEEVAACAASHTGRALREAGVGSGA